MFREPPSGPHLVDVDVDVDVNTVHAWDGTTLPEHEQVTREVEDRLQAGPWPFPWQIGAT